MLKSPSTIIGEYKTLITAAPDIIQFNKQIATKASVPVGSIDGGTWGSALAPFQESSAAFEAALPPFSAYDQMLSAGAFTRAPLHSHVVVAQSSAIASAVD